MAKTVVVVGALDTKGAEFAYLKDRLEAAGFCGAGGRGESNIVPVLVPYHVVVVDIDPEVQPVSGAPPDSSTRVLSRNLCPSAMTV